jgi:YgiT-type zinc finger domain-containing protein
MTEKKREATVPCTECQAGQMHRRFLTYFTWLAEELITVPDFPAWVCDVCGRRDYDHHALNHLNLLLTPNAGRAAARKPRASRGPEAKKGSRPSQAE